MRNVPLDELHAELAAWRRTKKHGDRIPDSFWTKIILVCGTNGLSLVARRLGLDFYQLRQRMADASFSEKKLTCSQIVNVAASVQLPTAPQLEIPLICEVKFPSGIIVRFFNDCESLRTLVSQGRN